MNVDEHTIRCIMKEEELIEMGYDLETLLQGQDQEILHRFIQDITQKANDAGFNLTENHRAIQSMILPGNHIILNFSDVLPEDQMNHMIKNFLAIANLVEQVGKDNLVDLLNQKGADKIAAFNRCLDLLKNGPSETPVSVNSEEDSPEDYIIKFPTFDSVEQFCKATPFTAPGKLYKKQTDYCLLLKTTAENINIVDRLILLASEFSGNAQPDRHFSRNLEEHGDIIIPENPIERLKYL